MRKHRPWPRLPMILNLRELQAFKAIAELGSLGKAADALNLTQPALTRTLKRLEHQLGVSLFERHAHGTTLTEYGRALEPHASLMLAESLNATRELREMLGQERGVVRVGTVASAVENFLPEAIARLTADRPGLQVHIGEGLADALAVQLAKGDVDLVIGFAVQHTRAGTIRALAVTGARRSALFPQVPTLGEDGFKDIEVLVWFGLVAPKSTDGAIINRLSRAVAAIAKGEEPRRLFLDSTSNPGAARPTRCGGSWRASRRNGRQWCSDRTFGSSAAPRAGGGPALTQANQD